MRPSRTLLASTIIAALGGLLFGFDTAVISGTTDALKRVYELDRPWLGASGGFWLGFTVASALVGTVIGSLAVGGPADRLGRRTTLLWMAVFYFVSAVGSGLAWDWSSFLLFRFLGGLAVGGASVVCPMYIAEISPAAMRGRLVAVQQFNIVFGILLAYLSNYVVAQLGFGEHAWRWMFGVEAIPAAAFFAMLFTVPDSPRWLVARRRIDEARSVLSRLGTDSGSVDDEVAAIQASLDVEHHSLAEPLFQAKYRTPILLAVAIAMFNQLSGINALMYYAPHIFKMAGAAEDSALVQSVIVGVTNLLFTMLAMAVIDRFGRRTLMLVGSVGYIASLSTVAWAFYTYGKDFTPTGSKIVLIGLLVFIASHAFGQGAVIWVFISEIFPNRVRARGQALGSFTHWIMAAAISWTFPMFAEASGAHTFAFYAAMMVLQLVWVILVMPETKGVPLEDIQRRFDIE
jgi:SP family xylose:H+ symportor-like MFS transporter